ncbi:MAG: helix-turn-helix domain-containing protein, partial [Nanoarchaeota archaeon]
MYEELTASGLTKAEARIYAALVELGKAQAGILSRKTGIHRRNVYDALERLIEKGFASFIRENNKRFYMASEPQKILDSIDAKKEALLS